MGQIVEVEKYNIKELFTSCKFIFDKLRLWYLLFIIF
jgi:hypothetical protein